VLDQLCEFSYRYRLPSCSGAENAEAIGPVVPASRRSPTPKENARGTPDDGPMSQARTRILFAST
jgi:hypothetical protein